MDLIIKGQEQTQQITWNYEEVKAWATEAVEQYANMIVAADQIAFAKEKRADLNKLSKALDDARKAEKKKCLQAYETFEKEIKEVVGIVNDASKAIDEQIKAFEEQRKAEKLAQIEAVFDELKKPADWLKLEHIMQAQWLNVTCSMNRIKKEINAKINNISNDLEVIRKLPEYSFEAEEYYSQNCDVVTTMREVQRLTEQAKRKAEIEAAKKAEQEHQQQAIEEMPQLAEPVEQQLAKTGHPTQPQRSWIGFQALLSVDDAMALKEFFNARNIKFKAIR